MVTVDVPTGIRTRGCFPKIEEEGLYISAPKTVCTEIQDDARIVYRVPQLRFWKPLNRTYWNVETSHFDCMQSWGERHYSKSLCVFAESIPTEDFFPFHPIPFIQMKPTAIMKPEFLIPSLKSTISTSPLLTLSLFFKPLHFPFVKWILSDVRVGDIPS